jgi:hypothetical protein
MDLKLSLILLAGLIALCQCEWANPIQLYDKKYISISPYAASFNSSCSVILLSTALRTDPNKAPLYGYLIHNNSFNSYQLINKDYGCVYGSFINVVKDEYYTVCTGTRTGGSSTAECDGNVNNGCSEMLFMESKGDAWSKPVFASRSNMKDFAHRTGASIVQSKTSKRIFIFYSTTEVFGKTHISYIMRPSGSAIFSMEAHIVSLKGQLHDRSVMSAITTVNSLQQLHVAWNENGSLYYTYSDNNGISWSTQSLISSITSIDQDIPSLQFLTFNNKPELLFLLSVSKTHKGEIRWLVNSVWKEKVIGERLQYVNGAVCEEIGKIIIIGRTIDMTLKGFKIGRAHV